MSEYASIKYANTFLNQVIIRVDFLDFLENDSIFNKELENVISRYYPKKSKSQIIRFNSFNVTFDAASTGLTGANNNIKEGLKKEYCSTYDKVFLTNKYIVFEINKYQSYAEHYKSISDILSAVFMSMKDPITTSRIGVRFINIFNPNSIKLRKNMFPAHISSIINCDSHYSDHLIRNMNVSEYEFGQTKLNFRYGYYNPRYPSLPLDKSFTLDFDCITIEQMSSSDDILKQINYGHELIQQMFEASITDSLRKVLNNE